MIKTILIILTTVSVITACGGDSPDSGSQTTTDKTLIGSGTSDEKWKIITISTSYKEHELRPKKEQTIEIKGSNNIVTITTEPNIVRISGSDNTVHIEKVEKVIDKGLGNVIIKLSGGSLMPG